MNAQEAGVLTVVTLGVFEMTRLWQGTAPLLSELRSAEPNDLAPLQKLVDADIVVGIPAMLAAGAAWILTKSVVASLLMLVTYGFMVTYYHSVRAASAV